tara:strand:+ start:48 stop:257 length:210 start_codon:yes stop_codon:yes gene_type:complete
MGKITEGEQAHDDAPYFDSFLEKEDYYYTYDHSVCFSYPMCDEAPTGCYAHARLRGWTFDQMDHFGHKG